MPEPTSLPLRHARRPVVVVALISASTVMGFNCSSPEPLQTPSGTNAETVLGGPRADLTAEQLKAFERGRENFLRVFTPETGLGPYYEETSCAGCHDHPVIGGSVLDRRVFVAPGPPPEFEALHYPKHALPGFPPRDQAPPGATGKRPPPLFGLGLLEEVPAEVVIAGCDPEDRDGDGVRGRPAIHDGRLFRFGRKAHEYSIRDFAANALYDDLNVTSGESDFYGQDEDALPDPEVPESFIDSLADYVRGLAPPRRLAAHPEGEAVFERIGCAACHRADLGPTARGAYTDMCLHDVGPELSDGITDKASTPQEYRTPPLWGLRFADAYLHDGRATTVEEAILAHGGEAAGARTRFDGLSKSDRKALLAFLATL